MEPLSSALPAALMPYGTFEVEIPMAERSRHKESSPMENQNDESSNLKDNLVRTFGLRMNSPFEKYDSQGPNPDDLNVRTINKTTPDVREEK